MKAMLKKLSVLAAVVTGSCTTTDYTITPDVVPASAFKPSDKGVVIASYVLQTCDRTEKYHTVEIDVNGDKKADYIGTTDAFKIKEAAQTARRYPVGRHVSMRKAADFFQWFERANCNCD